VRWMTWRAIFARPYSAAGLARSRHRRDRIVAWLCEYVNLPPFDQTLTGRAWQFM